MITCDIIPDPENLAAWEADWQRLFAAGSGELSTTFPWTAALIENSLKEDDRLYLAVLRDSWRITGFIPLVICTSERQGLAVNHLFPISEYSRVHSDLLVSGKASPEWAPAFFAALAGMGLAWDVFEMGSVLESNAMLPVMQGYCRQQEIPVQIERAAPSFYCSLAGGYEQYLQRRSNKFRHNLRHYERKLASRGGVAVRRWRDFASFDAAYAALLHIETRSWKYAHGSAITSSDKQIRFYRCICEAASAAGQLCLLFLFLDQEPIAYNLALIHDGRCYGLKSSHAEEFKAYSASNLLRARLIEELAGMGLEGVDFTGEPYEWEQHWADDLNHHKAIRVYNNTRTARALQLYYGLKNKWNVLREPAELVYADPRKMGRR